MAGRIRAENTAEYITNVQHVKLSEFPNMFGKDLTSWLQFAKDLQGVEAYSRTEDGYIGARFVRLRREGGQVSGSVEVGVMRSSSRLARPVKVDVIINSSSASIAMGADGRATLVSRPAYTSQPETSYTSISFSATPGFLNAPFKVEFMESPLGPQGKASPYTLWLLLNESILEPVLYEAQAFANTCRLVVADFSEITAQIAEYFVAHPNELCNLDPRKFEELICSVFRQQGYRTELGPGWKDSGVDMRLYQKDSIGEILTLVQVKRYRPDRAIRLEPVACLSAIVDQENANRGLFVTTSRFLPSAKAFAQQRQRRLALADSRDISEWLKSIAGAMVKKT
jgi:hypothetical protein